MNIPARKAELERKIDESRIFWRGWGMALPLTPEFPTRREIGWALSRHFNAEARAWAEELEALRAPMVSLTSHEGRLLLATGGGLFEVKDDTLTFVPLQVAA